MRGKSLFIFFIFLVSFNLFSKENSQTIKVKNGKTFSLALKGRNWIYTGEKTKIVKLIKISDYNVLQVFSFYIPKNGKYELNFVENNLFKKNKENKKFLIDVGKSETKDKKINGIDKLLHIKNQVAIQGDIVKKNELILEKTKLNKISRKLSHKKNTKSTKAKATLKKEEPKIEFIEEKENPKKQLVIKKQNMDKNQENENKDKDDEIIDSWFLNGISKKLSKSVRKKIQKAIKSTEEIEVKDQDKAIALYKKIILNYPFYDKLDEVYYRLAKIYENDGKNQNLVKAKDMYDSIVQKFSLSKYFDEAIKKVNYFKQFYNL